MKKIITLCLLLSSFMLRAQTDGFTPVCVDSVWYDSINPNIINVSIYNGSAVNLNYPSVQIVDPNGDTISNVNNYVMFFAQLNGTYTTYTDTITVTGITDFSGYTFVMNENFGSSNFNMSVCFITAVPEKNAIALTLINNPVSDWLYLKGWSGNEITYSVHDLNGRLLQKAIISRNEGINVSSLSAGSYFISVKLEDHLESLRFMKL